MRKPHLEWNSIQKKRWHASIWIKAEWRNTTYDSLVLRGTQPPEERAYCIRSRYTHKCQNVHKQNELNMGTHRA